MVFWGMPMASSAENQRNLSELKEAFESFNTVSDQLQNAYLDLQNQVAELQQQLQTAQQQRVEEAQRNADLAGRLTALLEALPGGVIMLDQSGVVREINSAAGEFLGDPLEDMQWQTVCRSLLSIIKALEHLFRPRPELKCRLRRRLKQFRLWHMV